MLEVTPWDMEEARRCLQQDKIILTSRGIFRGLLFCLLSIGQLYKTQLSAYRNLLWWELDSPDRIQAQVNVAKMIVWTARFPSSIWTYIVDLCDNWGTHREFFRENFILRAPHEDNAFALREELVRRLKGFGYKVASLFLCLCGVSNIATIDVWALRFLADRGYPIRLHSVRKGGLPKAVYLQCEQYMRQEAKKYNMSVAFFQAVVWVKFSSWNKGVHPAQQWLPFGGVGAKNLEANCNNNGLS